MGRPLDPSEAQVEQLNRETALPAPEGTALQANKMSISLTPNELALIKIQP